MCLSDLSLCSPTAAVGMMAAGYMPPSHQVNMALGLTPATATAGFSTVSSVSSASAIQAASVASTAGCDYASFSQFDPHMEGPPNASALGRILILSQPEHNGT